MSKNILVFLSPGIESMQTVLTVDVLRRAGFNTIFAGVNGPDTIVCSMGVKIVPDVDLRNVQDQTFDAVVVPGGYKAAEICESNTTVGAILSRHFEVGKLVAAICSGPTVLLSHKIGYGRSITSHPEVKRRLLNDFKYSDDRVVHDGNLITSQGPGTAFEFALKIIEYLEGIEKVQLVKEPMRLNF